MQVLGAIVSALALLCINLSEAWANGAAGCISQLTREEAINLLAEGSVRAAKGLPFESPVDRDAIEDARRRISTRLNEGWELQVKQLDDCTASVSYKHPKRFDGFTVRVDEKKRLVDFLSYR